MVLNLDFHTGKFNLVQSIRTWRGGYSEGEGGEGSQTSNLTAFMCCWVLRGLNRDRSVGSSRGEREKKKPVYLSHPSDRACLLLKAEREGDSS